VSVNSFTTTYAQNLRGFDREKSFIPVVPRNSFSFFIEFGFNEEAVGDSKLQWVRDSIQVGNSAYVKSFTKPSYQIEIEKIRAYNKPYHLKKRIEYKELSLVLYDDNRSVSRDFVELYRNYYGQTGNPSPTGTSPEDVSNPVATPRSSGGENMGLKTRTNADRNLLNYIRIYDLGTDPTNVQIYTIFNPVITGIDSSALDYTDGEGMQEITVTLDYTYYDYSGNNNAFDMHYEEAFFADHLNKNEIDLKRVEKKISFDDEGLFGIFDGVRDTLQGLGIDPGDLVQSVQRSIQGGELNLSDLRRNVFQTLAEGTPIQNIRNVIRNVRLIEQALYQGRFTDIVPLVGGGLGQLRNFDPFGYDEIAKGIRATIDTEVSQNVTWLQRHLNPKVRG
tara:strand:- start:798 stop:1970 length:1173 start_codon:yes stop_codon:yes gene_type:complete